jgi:hypothetical protein
MSRERGAVQARRLSLCHLLWGIALARRRARRDRRLDEREAFARERRRLNQWNAPV